MKPAQPILMCHPEWRLWTVGVVVSLALFLAASVIAGDTTSITVSSTKAAQGITYSVPVGYSHSTNSPSVVVAVQADLLFDPVNLTIGQAVVGASVATRVMAASTPTPGVQRIVVYSLNNLALSNGVIATIPFTVSPTAPLGRYSLVLTNVMMTTAGVNPITSSNLSGYLDLNPVFVRADGNMDLFLKGTSGQAYVVQATTNFVQWVNISTNIANQNFLVTLTDTDAHLYPRRYYRLMLYNPATGQTTGPVSKLPDGRVSFRISGTTGQNYVVQASTNLLQWVNLSTNAAAGGVVNYIDAGATNFPNRFYRLKNP